MSKDNNAAATAGRTSASVATCSASDIELMQRQAEAQFALTPMGQALKQFEICQRMGSMFAQTSIVPAAYRSVSDKGQPNPSAVANCAVAVDMALRMNLPPMMVMQNLYVVHGNPAWSSKFLIACINGCGRYTTLEYHFKDNTAKNSMEYGCRCVAYEKSDIKRERPLAGPWVTWAMVQAEGWLDKNGSKWRTMPELMFRYRAAALWQRTYAPELAMGMLSVEEVRDMPSPERAVVDTRYEDLTPAMAAEIPGEAEAAPAAPEISDARLAEALEALAAAATAADVKTLKDSLADVYEGSEMFRDALIERFQQLNAADNAAKQ